MMIIKPHISVGSLNFSDTKEELRSKINSRFEEGVKEFDLVKERYDYFPNAELFVYYDVNGIVNAFEFYKSNPILNGIDLLSIPYKNIINLLSEFDGALVTEYDGFTSNKYGIGGCTNDDPEDENAMPESIIVFRQGYYDLQK